MIRELCGSVPKPKKSQNAELKILSNSQPRTRWAPYLTITRSNYRKELIIVNFSKSKSNNIIIFLLFNLVKARFLKMIYYLGVRSIHIRLVEYIHHNKNTRILLLRSTLCVCILLLGESIHTTYSSSNNTPTTSRSRVICIVQYASIPYRNMMNFAYSRSIVLWIVHDV